MTRLRLYKPLFILSIVTGILVGTGFEKVFAQVTSPTSVELATIPKIVMFIFTLGGLFTGYIMLRMSIKLADLDAKVVKMVAEVERSFASSLKAEIYNTELKIQLGIKEMETKMATFTDIKNIEKIQQLQHENILEKIKGLEKQLTLAASKLTQIG